MDLTQPETQAENCSLCGELPDDLTVNTGREQDFPAAFYKLTPVGIPCPDQGQRVGSQFRRCPNCGMYFDWGDYPQVYGSGNCDEERLIRLSTRASLLLNNLFPPDPKAPPDLGDVGEYFEALPLDLLLRALSSQVGTVPNIVTPFVPNLVRLLGKSDDTSVGNSIRSLLSAYVSGSPERAKEIEAAQAQYAFIINETASANDYLQKGLDYLSGKDYQEAITHFDKVLELNGKAESIDVGLKRKTNIDAIGSAELSKNRSIRDEQNFSALYHRGIAFSAVRNEEGAIRSFTRAIKLKPRASEVIFRRALIFQGMRKSEEAAIDYTRVIELEPDNFEAFFNRASCHSGRNAHKYKIEDLSKAIELRPDFLRAYYERAEVFWLDKLFDEALGDYTKITELDPGSTNAYYQRGLIFQRLGDTPRAVEECNKLQQIAPGSGCFCTHHANYVKPATKFEPAPCRLCSCSDFSEAHMSDPLCHCGHLYKMHG